MDEQKNTEITVNPTDKPIPVETDFLIGGPTPEATIKVEGDTATSKLSTDGIIPAPNRIVGSENPDILNTTPGDDLVLAKGGDDTIFGSLGDDIYSGGNGFDTLDYTLLGKKITLLPQGLIGNGNSQGSQIQEIERIVGAQGKDNTIDGSGGKTNVFFTIDLAEEQLIVENIPGLGSVEFEVENFKTVEGTENADTIIGSDEADKLSGNGGNDTIIGNLGSVGGDTLLGGSGNDTLIGSDPSVSTTLQSERDILTGGSDVDKYVLGNDNGSFYDDFEGNDFANITDFQFGETIQLSGQETYTIDQINNGFRIFVIEDSGQDLIANVTFSFGVASLESNEKSALLKAGSELTVESATSAVFADIPDGEFTINSGEQKGIFVA
ncbi:MAG: calcium-binding protein [Cyanobacteria bacterium P01_D01_bin.116]